MSDTTTTDTAQAVTTTTIDASELARVLGNAVLFTSKDRTRPILTNVRVDVDTDSLTVEATDSYALLRESTPAMSGEPGGSWSIPVVTFFVDKDDAARVIKASKGQKVGTVNIWTVGDVTTWQGSGWSLTTTGYITDVSQWPKTAQLWPSEYAGVTGDGVGFGLQQMARLAKLVTPAGLKATDTSAALKVRYNGDVKPFTCTSGTLTVLVMPCRIP